jgi:hypothetical protein
VSGYPFNRCIRWAPEFPPTAIYASLTAQYPSSLTCQQKIDNTYADLWIDGWDAALGTWVSVQSVAGYGSGSCSGWQVSSVASESIGPFQIQSWSGHVFTALRLKGRAMLKDPSTGLWSYVPVTLSTEPPPVIH